MQKIFYMLLIIVIFGSCAVIKEMIPVEPSKAISPNDINTVSEENFLSEDKIGYEYFTVKGFQEPHTPPLTTPTDYLRNFLMESRGDIDLNSSAVVRVYNKEKQSKNIQILVSGIYSGAGTVFNLAKAIVRRNADIEVWIWERRANQLEDRRIIMKALKENKPDMLKDLLIEGKFKLKDKRCYFNPKTEDISFLGYWGINVQLGDLLNVVKLANEKAENVILSGYSLGVLYVTTFLANDFGNSEKSLPGYTLIDKALLFDGPPMIEGYIDSENSYNKGLYILPVNYVDGKERLESGRCFPANGTGDRDISIFFLSAGIKPALAKLDPHGISLEKYKSGIKELDITNLAKYAMENDDNYNQFKLFTSSFGLADAKHSGKYNYSDSIKVVEYGDGKNIIDWIVPEKSSKVEFNNINDYLNAALNEEFDIAEWYQPTRILLDLGSIHLNNTNNGWQNKYFKIKFNKDINIPVLALGLSRGLSRRSEIYEKYKKSIDSKDFSIIMVDSITHVDGDTMSDSIHSQVVADINVNWLLGNPLTKR